MVLRRVLAGSVLLLLLSPATIHAQGVGGPIPPDILARARAGETIRIIAALSVPTAPEPILGTARAAAQREAIGRAQESVLRGLRRPPLGQIRRWGAIPFIALEADLEDLEALARMPEIASVQADRLARPTLAQSSFIVGAPAAWNSSYTGAGWAVAILDTGVDKNHPFLAGRVISEACYSSSRTAGSETSTSLCPGGVASSTAPGAAIPCALDACAHGTHVAGIAAGKGSAFSGVAPDASIIAVQVFSSFTSGCGGTPSSPAVCSWESDQISGLLRVYDLRSSHDIAAVNMSLGGGLHASICDGQYPALANAIGLLRAAGIATVVSSGNQGSGTALSSPACISTAVSVGATTKSDQVWALTNSNAQLSLLAPGVGITSSVPGGGFSAFNGTSMAAPHVAGAWAVLRSRAPGASVSAVLSALAGTGPGIFDPANGLIFPRINLNAAVQALPGACTYDVSPATATMGRLGGTVAVSVSSAPGCPWSASAAAGFVTVTSGGSGSGHGTAVLTIAPNPFRVPRAGSAVVAGVAVTIRQAGVTGGDVNGDGTADLVWQHRSQGWLATWFLDGHSVVGTRMLTIDRVTDPQWRVAGTGDVDGDGYADLVWQHEGQGWLAVWFLRGFTVIGTSYLEIDRVADTDWRIQGVGDVNGDGRADLIWQHRTGGWLAVWYLDGIRVVGTRYLSIDVMADPGWQIAGAGDIDGDGKADIVWQHSQGWLAAWLLDGHQVVGTRYLSIDRMPDPNWKIRGVGDTNADGRADLIWQNDATGGLGLWYLQGFQVVGQRNLSIDRVEDTGWRVVGPG